ncbi:MAG: hypothetical protein ABIQ70_10320 [Dokdonella sp.]
MLSTFLSLATLLNVATGVAAAPAKPTPAPMAAPRTPGCAEPERHELDFWLGDWDTFEPEGPLGKSQARAHVDSILAGCALHELYEQTDGLIGDSFLGYDSITRKWQQTWLTNFGAYMFLTGSFKDGTLTLEGTSHTKTRDIPSRITWKAEKGGVRETGVMSLDGGKTWVPAFDVLFLRHKD